MVTDIVDKKGHSTSVVWRYFVFLQSDTVQTIRAIKNRQHHKPVSSFKTMSPFRNEDAKKLQSQTSVGKCGPSTSTSATTQQSLMSSFSKAVPYDKKTKRHGDITKAVAYCIAKDMLPISLVENEGFKNLIHVLDPRYELPGRKHFSQTALPRLYTECRETVERQLQNVQFFATTSDIWSSRTSEPYLSLTIHFVDEDWNLQSKCLQTA